MVLETELRTGTQGYGLSKRVLPRAIPRAMSPPSLRNIRFCRSGVSIFFMEKQLVISMPIDSGLLILQRVEIRGIRTIKFS